MKWSVVSESLAYDRAYSFTYDAPNRLTAGNYCGISGGSVYSGTSGKYNESVTYDNMGNILTLNRIQDGNGLNQLTYTYSGNHLTKVDNALSPVLLYGSEAFNDRAKIATEYLYDKNGNTIYDANGGISTISYNLLNLPAIVQFTEGHQNRYSYSADGKKLANNSYTRNSVITVPQGSIISTLPADPSNYVKVTTNYVANVIYQNGVVTQVQTSEGYIQGTTYYYYLKDHLGNNRIVINGSGTTVEKSHYYPFGMRFYSDSSTASSTISFHYNGKEYDSMNGFNHYDYGARFYDPSLGRWNVPDPLAEKGRRWSPYAYAFDNPIRFVDPDGMWAGKYYNENGQEIFDDKKDDHKIYVIKTTKTTEQLYDKNQNDPGNANSISSEVAASTEESIKSGDLTGDHMKNVAYVGTETQINNMLDIIGDNGTRGELPMNNREYGGKINKDGEVIGSKPGPIMDPMNQEAANVEINAAKGEKSFHSHPSGTKLDGKYIRGWGSRSQAPSGTDIKTSTSNSEYVFGMRSYTLFLYNSKGVYATMPLNLFTK